MYWYMIPIIGSLYAHDVLNIAQQLTILWFQLSQNKPICLCLKISLQYSPLLSFIMMNNVECKDGNAKYQAETLLETSASASANLERTHWQVGPTKHRRPRPVETSCRPVLVAASQVMTEVSINRMLEPPSTMTRTNGFEDASLRFFLTQRTARISMLPRFPSANVCSGHIPASMFPGAANSKGYDITCGNTPLLRGV